MNYSVGTTLGHYKILEPIGAGGMGEVYKAQDSRLERAVALKVLPPSLVSDSERVRRFIGEARAASALNHPHIVAIYDIGDSQPQPPSAEGSSEKVYYIAMEYVDGSTLQAKIHRERAELKKVLEYFAQAADGLAKAHSAGIVHRDLKPENIMINVDGYAKILDFGLAKLVEPEAEDNPPTDPEEAQTAMMARTQAGVVMGTIGYMSPEQAQGKPVDHRSDIFSFGCMLYEAATGQKPFQGDSLIDSLHKIVYAQAPPIRDNNPNAPAELQRIIRKCLAKDPAERYQSVRDVAIDLRELIKEYDSQPTVSFVSVPAVVVDGGYPGAHTHSVAPGMQSAVTVLRDAIASDAGAAVSGSRRGVAGRWIAIIGALVLLAAVGIVSVYIFYGQKSAKVTGPAFDNIRITKLTSSGQSLQAVISPDGKYVVHSITEAGKSGLWVRQTATSSNVQIVPSDEGRYVGMTFSRDGNYVYFVKGENGATVSDLFQIPVLGGTPKNLIHDVDSAISFSPDSRRFVFVRHGHGESSLIIVDADGSNERKLTTSRQPDVFLQPAWSPDGKVIASSMRKVTGGYRFETVAVQVADGSVKTLGSDKWLSISGVAWLPTSTALVLCGHDQTLGGRTQIWELSYPAAKLRKITNDLNDYSGVSVSADGQSLVTVQATSFANVFVAPAGDENRARQITQGSGKYDQVTWTPDGRVVYVSDISGSADIWVMDSDGSNQRQLTVDSGINVFPTVSGDGKYVVFDSNRGQGLTSFSIWRTGLDGTNPRQLTQGEGDFFPTTSVDGKWAIYTRLTAGTKPTLWKVPIDGGEASELTDKSSVRPVVSPDGKLIACQYSSTQPDQPPVLGVLPIEGGQAVHTLKIPLTQYRWSSDSKSILFVDSKQGIWNIWSQPIEGGDPRQITKFNSGQIFSFDWSKDGKQLLCTRGTLTTDAILIKDQSRETKP